MNKNLFLNLKILISKYYNRYYITRFIIKKIHFINTINLNFFDIKLKKPRIKILIIKKYNILYLTNFKLFFKVNLIMILFFKY